MDLELLMDELTNCMAAGDVEGLTQKCAPDCRVKQNVGEEGGLDDLLALIGGISAAGVSVSYSDIRRVVGKSAVTEQHLVTLRRSDGVETRIDVCVVVRFGADGRVISIDEYLDGSGLAQLLG